MGIGAQICVIVISLFSVVHTQQGYVLNLEDLNWTLDNSRGFNNVSDVAGKVPGDCFTDLMNAGIIGDPYYRYNDMNYRWISHDNWTYNAPLTIPSYALTNSRILLAFDGLDTIATVKVNDIIVGKADNMFRNWVFDIKNLLSTSNLITIEFTSSAAYAKQKAKENAYDIPESRYQTGEPHRNFIRTSQCHFSWDWGPCFLTQGVWLSGHLISYSDAIIQYVAPKITPKLPKVYTAWNVEIDVYVLPAGNSEGVFTLTFANNTSTFNVYLNGTALVKQKLSFDHIINQNELWMPRGYGNPTLFNLSLTYQSRTSSTNKTLSSPLPRYQVVAQQIGFREVQIVQEPVPGSTIGLSFYISVNGVPVFAKGANWIPVDAFESRVTPKRIDELVESAYLANMNTLRNWGGGIYQHDRFYEICDQKGLMVWEEFMFACGMYPRDDAFLNTVKEEVTHQVLRLMHHPSIIIWSGNNENELALGSGSSTGWYPETELNPFLYVIDYNYLNTETLYKTINFYDNTRPWIPSSPSNGILETTPYVERWNDPASPYWGDVHYYNYDDLCTNTSIYPTPRFASEYGFQSYPSFKILSNVSTPEDWSVFSKWLTHRQHHPRGNIQLDHQMLLHFNYPNSTNSTEQFSDWLYLTQCVQALCIRAESEHYRRLKGESANTMGALYWQLNSIWQAPTWSSLEYGNHWKILHYHVAHFFNDTIISSYVDNNNNYIAYLTTDVYTTQSGTWTINAVRWADNSIAQSWSSAYTLPSFGSKQIFKAPLQTMLQQANAANSTVLFTLTWTVNSQVVAANEFYLTSFAEIVLPPVSFNYTVTASTSSTVSIVLYSTALAPFTFLETAVSGRFSDNGFLSVPSAPRTITFFASESFTLQEFESSLIIRSVRDTY